ncbi:MBL fold metallo-hydrolase [Nonomuraea jiangxiensis]|uniref:Metallo-beta-lactamase superfamily protein n=1 Tax=Nonomuraea jiangxiensis TaxID=633440 RepID=A0A1G9P4L3_9ACTN|nr:MBL fold metallo-hydrolase [Nonomuraea jiangxiensis]SDL93167.1 Metallo-beta-lactamase superfamily protein [Nonomuraea jiangxiensis]
MKQSRALLRATRWPGVSDRLLALLAVQLLSARRYREGLEHFAALSAERPDSALAQSLTGVFKAHLEGPVEEALADLDRATERDLGLPHFFRGTTLAGFPDCAGRAETVIADLEFVLAVRDQFPPGFMHAVHRSLARGYECAGRTQDALDAQERVGHGYDVALVTDYLADADHGLRFGPPRLVEAAPGVHVAQGYDFADFAFVITGTGVVAIDAGSDPRHVEAALRDLRAITEEPITHVILTHAHFDHVGGLEALTKDGGQVIAQAGFPDELRLQAASPPPFPYLLPRDTDHRKQVVPDRLVSRAEAVTIGGVEFGLIPIRGGESADGLLIHLPGQDVVFTGDMCMPYLGAPFFPEGSAEGLFEAIQTVQDLRPQVLVHGHTALTVNFTAETFPGLLAALRDLHAAVLAGIADGRPLVELLDLDHLPEVLRDHPAAINPYLVMRDGFVQRVHHQATGYWHSDGTGVEHFSAEEWAGALDLLGGGNPDAFATAGEELLDRGEPALALRITEYGLLRHPLAPALASLRERLLLALVERNQFFDPFKFAYYAGLAGLTLAPAG